MTQTSYFASKAPAGRKVCIARVKPRYFAGPWAPEFAPANPWDKAGWRERYRAELEARFPDAESLRAALARVEAMVKDPILCCYEKDPEACHRGVLASFIAERLGVTVPEWVAAEQRGSLVDA